MQYLPDGVSVFASVDGAPKDRLGSLSEDEIIDCHGAIVEASSQEVGVLWVDVQTHYSTACREYEPGERGRERGGFSERERGRERGGFSEREGGEEENYE